MSELTGRQVGEFQRALLSAFDYARLRQMVRIELDESLEAIALTGNLEIRVFDLIEWAEMEGRTQDLVDGAVASVPGNPALRSWVEAFRRSIQRSVGGAALQRIVDTNQRFHKVRRWRDKLERIERQVCRIEIDGRSNGTGFLVAADVVLTNHHVVEPALRAGRPGRELAARFDYQLALDRDLPELGRAVPLADADWLLAASPHDEVDTKPAAERGYEPDRRHLDYALLRLAAPAGEEDLGDGTRAFIALPADPPPLVVDGPIFIVQHPGGDTMDLAFNTVSIREVNAEKTRLRHRTNTQSGSSGSPTFDSDWNLVALHQSGDPTTIRPEFNQGIPIQTVREELNPAVRQAIGW